MALANMSKRIQAQGQVEYCGSLVYWLVRSPIFVSFPSCIGRCIDAFKWLSDVQGLLVGGSIVTLPPLYLPIHVLLLLVLLFSSSFLYLIYN